MASKRQRLLEALIALTRAEQQVRDSRNPVVRTAVRENDRTDSTHAKFFEPE